jgi:hypothetical protein
MNSPHQWMLIIFNLREKYFILFVQYKTDIIK